MSLEDDVRLPLLTDCPERPAAGEEGLDIDGERLDEEDRDTDEEDLDGPEDLDADEEE